MIFERFLTGLGRKVTGIWMIMPGVDYRPRPVTCHLAVILRKPFFFFYYSWIWFGFPAMEKTLLIGSTLVTWRTLLSEDSPPTISRTRTFPVTSAPSLHFNSKSPKVFLFIYKFMGKKQMLMFIFFNYSWSAHQYRVQSLGQKHYSRPSAPPRICSLWTSHGLEIFKKILRES